MKRTVAGAAAVGAVAALTLQMLGAAPARAIYGDTHIMGQGIEQMLDCNNGTLFVYGSQNVIQAAGTCWAVSLQGSGNTVIADTVVNDITVFGIDQTVLFRNGEPALIDRGRELGMANRLQRLPG